MERGGIYSRPFEALEPGGHKELWVVTFCHRNAAVDAEGDDEDAQAKNREPGKHEQAH